MEGQTATPLRPTGVAIFNGQRTDVLTNGEPVDRDAAIRVVSVEGNRVVVAPVERRIG
jgi:membrane-bound serine protease (ClpP class)